MKAVFEAWYEKVKSELSTSLPGYIVKYDSNKLLADVQPVIKEELREKYYDPPIIHNVKIYRLANQKGVITLPEPQPNDPVILIFSGKSLDEWKESDGKTIHKAVDTRRHNFNDCFCFLGGETNSEKFAIPKPEALSIVSKENTPIYIGNEKGIEVVDLLHQTLLEIKKLVLLLSGNVNAAGVSSAPTLVKIVADLQEIAVEATPATPAGGSLINIITDIEKIKTGE
jgi:hypothetical protein